MNRPPRHGPIGLTRQSVGVTDAHRELIHILAAIAVRNYLTELDRADAPEAVIKEDRP